MLHALVSLLPLLTFSAALNQSQEYSSGSLGNYPANWAHGDHYRPVLNFDPPPSETPSPGYVFIAPRGSNVTNPGAMILTSDGELVWDGSAYGETMAFSKQTYLGNEILAVWTGQFNSGGYGYGHQVLLDRTYTVIKNVSTTLEGQTNDFHEFQITANDTALIDIYVTTDYDLSSYGVETSDGTQGHIMSGHVQEINITSGEALFSWNSLDHINPTDCYAEPGVTGGSADNPWDYFHINSVEKDSAGNYLISSRHCHALYYLSGDNGTVLWSLGGRNSSFDMGNGTAFYWQHDARWRNNESQISLFDNGAAGWEQNEDTARGLLLNVDMDNMSVTLETELLAPSGQASPSQGGMELTDNGDWIVGWGSQAWVSEFAPNGTELSSFQFGVTGPQSYRALKTAWEAYPNWSPSIAGPNGTDGNTVYLSWNGATEVAQWSLISSSSADGSSPTGVTAADSNSFETAIEFDSSILTTRPYLQGVALSSNGSALGYTNLWNANDQTTTPPSDAQEASVTIGTASFTGQATTSAASPSPTGGESGAVMISDVRGVLPALLVIGLGVGMMVSA